MAELLTIEEKAVELIEKFETLAVDIAPDAIELGLLAARVAAAQDAITMALTIAIVWWGLARGIPAFTKADWDATKFADAGPSYIATGLIGVVVTAVGSIKLLTTASIWPFVGIFYPELWIAKQVLGW